MAAVPSTTIDNPFGHRDHTRASPSDALVAVESSRAVAETQAAMAIAKRFPRDPMAAMDRILNACTRPTLAEASLYTYSRGGTDVTGPSIRLAEALAQSWGNLQFGVRELEQRDGASTVEAFAWDIETNVRQTKVFQVRHWRDTKTGGYALKDSRDIYELTANQGARRLRACILGVIPGDVVDAAVKQCDTTLKTKAEVTPERLKGLVEKFAEFGVTKEQIEARIQRHLEAMTPAQMVDLGKKYNSLKDGMSQPGDWFESGLTGSQPAEAAPKSRTASVVERAKRNKDAPKESQAAQPAAPHPAEPAHIDGGAQVVDDAGQSTGNAPIDLATVLRYIKDAKSSEVASEAVDLARGLPGDEYAQACEAYNAQWSQVIE